MEIEIDIFVGIFNIFSFFEGESRNQQYARVECTQRKDWTAMGER